MLKSFYNTVINIYHKILNLFFEFDVAVYGEKTSKIPVHKVSDIKYKRKIYFNNLACSKIKNNIIDLSISNIKNYILPHLQSGLIIRKFSSLLNNFIKIREENLNYFCIVKNYAINFINYLKFNEESFVFEANTHKSLKKEIAISRELKTVEEILYLEPYINNFDIKKILKMPVVKMPVKKELFLKTQLDYIRTKLAAEAKCKKYSITIENIFDKIPEGLYSKIELTKNNTIVCTLANNNQIGELQFLVTGKRKYDTQLTKTFIKYSEING